MEQGRDGRLILEGLRVLDVGSYVAGPAATTVLGDFGADVIKVEPPGGDPLRRLHALPGMPLAPVDYCWVLDARNKRSIVLDLEAEEGQRAIRALIARADVFVTNYPPRVLEKLRLRHEDVAPLAPRLVYAWLTGYGESGAEAGKPGFDTTAYWARSGLMDAVRDPENAPVASMPGQGDHPTALALFGAIMLGLFERERTGRGCRVGSSLLANGLWSNSILGQAALCGATFQPRLPRRERPNALSNSYETSDRRWFQLNFLNGDDQFPRFLAAIAPSGLEEDARFATAEGRRLRGKELREALEELFRKRSWEEWSVRFNEHRIPVSLIERIADLPADAQARASGAVVPIAGADGPPMSTISSPIWVAGRGKRPAGPAPALGQHTDEILAELGLRPPDATPRAGG